MGLVSHLSGIPPSSYAELDDREIVERLQFDLACFGDAIKEFPSLFGLYSEKKTGAVKDKFAEFDDLRKGLSDRRTIGG